MRAAAVFVIFAITLLIVYLAFEGTKTFSVDKFPVWKFLFSSDYDPANNEGGAAVFIAGTLLVTGFAIVVGGPFGIAVGVFLSEIAPPRMAHRLAKLRWSSGRCDECAERGSHLSSQSWLRSRTSNQPS